MSLRRTPARRRFLIRAGIVVTLDAMVDPERSWVISDDHVSSKCGWAPYAGRRVVGGIEAPLLRGRMVYEYGEVMGIPGGGGMASPG